MGRPVGSTNLTKRKDNDCVHRLPPETEQAIRRLCKSYGITAVQYYELSALNSPHHKRPLSYGRFAQAMAGQRIAEEHSDMLGFSLLTVRQELRRLGVKPLAKTLMVDCIRVMKHYEKDCLAASTLTKSEVSALRRIFRQALARMNKA